jgi:hypothetical protein
MGFSAQGILGTDACGINLGGIRTWCLEGAESLALAVAQIMMESRIPFPPRGILSDFWVLMHPVCTLSSCSTIYPGKSYTGQPVFSNEKGNRHNFIHVYMDTKSLC